MKKGIKLLSILFLITLILVGCSSNNENNAKTVAEKFGRNLYTVDSKKVAEYNTLNDYIGTNIKADEVIKLFNKVIQSIDKNIQPLMTEAAYKSLYSNREDIMNTQGCAINNYTMQVTDFTLTKNFYDAKQNTAEYYYTTKLKFISIKDKSEQVDTAKGNIGLIKVNGQWKVSAYKTYVIPKLVLKR
jgi:hypothetical protein